MSRIQNILNFNFNKYRKLVKFSFLLTQDIEKIFGFKLERAMCVFYTKTYAKIVDSGKADGGSVVDVTCGQIS